MKQEVLLTGGSGFIGSCVTDELLKRGYVIHSVSIDDSFLKHQNLITHNVNLLNSDDLKDFMSKNKFKNMIHLAWYTGKGCHGSNLNMDWAAATINLLKTFKENGGERFLGAGSVSEYAFEYGFLREDKTPLTSPSLYGQAKAAVYNMGKIFCKSNDIDFKWARIFNLYGPKEKSSRLMPSVICSALRDEDIKVSTCTKQQDYLHVFDTARGIVDLFESDVNGAVNISSGRPTHLRDIVLKIAELTNFKGDIKWGAIPTSFDDEFVCGDNTRLVKEVGWKQQISMEEGLKQTINWWKTKGLQNVR